MQISGKDSQFTSLGMGSDTEMIALYLVSIWPDMVVEHERESAELYSARKAPLADDLQTYFYKDMAAYEAVRDWGVTDDVQESCVFVVIDEGTVCLTTGPKFDLAPLLGFFYRGVGEHDGRLS